MALQSECEPTIKLKLLCNFALHLSLFCTWVTSSLLYLNLSSVNVAFMLLQNVLSGEPIIKA